MKNLFRSMFAAMLMASAVSCSGGTSNSDFVELFNGKDFTGFEQLGGNALFKVEDGMLVGVCTDKEPSSFMATKESYGDFILEFEVLNDTLLNTGVQIRSHSIPEYNNGRVHGYQVEIEASDRAWSGGIFEEGRRGWLVSLLGNEAGRKALNRLDWNHYRVEALGNNIRVWVNGIPTANLYDDMESEGFIAFQIHIAGGEKIGRTTKWRNIVIDTVDVASKRIVDNIAPVTNNLSNTLAQEEIDAGWKLLFDGETTNGWRNAHKETFPSSGWSVKNGVLTIEASDGGESTNAGDIVTVDEYSAFELSVDFRITPGANSGIKYFVTEEEQINPNHKVSAFGLEFQILDDAEHKDAKLYTSVPGSRTMGSLYDMIAAPEEKNFPQAANLKFMNRWSTARIKVFPNGHVEHWLNGAKTVEYDRCTDAFRELVKGSKYAAPAFNTGAKPFGEAESGHILLQDHGNEVHFRNIKIRELK